MNTPRNPSPRLLAIGWAAFLACSWTWCIGMFLPVLLVRDYGFAGWAVFSIPNVIGAAAMGWVLHRQGSASDLSHRHRPAAVAFSIVTILFHAFFAGWIVRSLVGNVAGIITFSAAGGFYLAGRRGYRDLLSAAILLAFSIIAFAWAASVPDQTVNGPSDRMPGVDLFYLAPICVFGFFLNPYLDLTFLRARESTAPRVGIAAFTFGFGIFFMIMLLFTFWYARVLQPGRLQFLPGTLKWIIGTHMMLQSGFTVAVHTRALSNQPSARRPDLQAALFLALLCGYFAGQHGDLGGLGGHSLGETLYRIFMAFYGLVFPAYVWLCIIPSRGQPGVPSARNLQILAATVVIAAPLFWMGFIENHMLWLVAGLGIVLLSRLAIQPPKLLTDSRS